MWKNILVPHDFSPCAERALGLAAELAKAQEAALWLLHVTELPENLARDTPVQSSNEKVLVPLGEYARSGAARRLEGIAEPLRRQGLSVATKAVLGTRTEAILRVAHELRSDLIVVGTHGRTGLSHMWLGSVAEKLVRFAPVPVLTVRAESPEAEPTSEERQAEDELTG
jgi:nucleotide-binding universal stress UspA family protein